MIRAFYLTVMEMKLLLYKRKISGLVMFDELRPGDESDTDIKKALESLITNKYLVRDKDAFSFSTETEEILNVLSGAVWSFRLSGMQGRVQTKCMYVSETASLILEMDARSENMVRIEYFHEAGAVKEIMDFDFLPDTPSHDVSSAEEAIERRDLKSDFEKPDGRLLIERYRRGSADIDRLILVTEKATEDHIYIDDGTRTIRTCFTEDSLRKALLEENNGIG